MVHGRPLSLVEGPGPDGLRVQPVSEDFFRLEIFAEEFLYAALNYADAAKIMRLILIFFFSLIMRRLYYAAKLCG